MKNLKLTFDNMRHTVILYTDWHREIQYWYTAPVNKDIEIISYPYIRDADLEEIKQATLERLQVILKQIS